jgi:hypothetical protein
MFNYHERCLFCFSNLSKEPKGKGEHVIPRNIFGFWRVYDVCDDCKQYFGDHVDNLAVQHPSILAAMEALELPAAEKLSENLHYYAEDTVTKHKLPVIKKGDTFKIKVNYPNDELFECDEGDWEKIRLDQNRINARGDLSQDEFEIEIQRLKHEFKKIAPGKSIDSSKLGIEIRKRQFTNVTIDNQKVPSITPLIAKIVICFLSYVLSDDQIKAIEISDMLRRHARFGEPLREFTVNWCPLFKEKVYRKYHRLRLEFYKDCVTTDVSLFGYANWRVIMRSAQSLLALNLQELPYDGASIILDFKNIDQRRKLFGFRQIGTQEYVYHQFDI